MFIVLSDIHACMTYLCVNISDFQLDDAEDKDSSCVLPPGVHRFIVKLSHVRYDYAEELTEIEILSFRKEPDITPSILASIKRGYTNTKSLPKKFRIKYPNLI